MGIVVKSKTKSEKYSCSSFNYVRGLVAEAIDEDLGKAYNYMTRIEYSDADKIQDAEFVVKEVIQHNDLGGKNQDLIDFLFMPDEEGSVKPETCKKIYDLIGRINLPFSGVSELADLCLDCYNNNSILTWSC